MPLAAVMHPRRPDLQPLSGRHQGPLGGPPVAHHQPVTLSIDQLEVTFQVPGDLGLQRRQQHPPRSLSN